RHQRKHTLAQHDDRFRNVNRPVSHDRTDPRAGRLVRPEERHAGECRDVSSSWRHVFHFAHWDSAFDRRIEFFAGSDAWPSRGAFSHAGRTTLLNTLNFYDAKSSFAF